MEEYAIKWQALLLSDFLAGLCSVTVQTDTFTFCRHDGKFLQYYVASRSGK
jgi:hypothetical protein